MKTLRKRIFFRLFSSIFCIALSACTTATLNQAQCTNADWSSIGYQDALNGQQHTVVKKHQQACAEYGISPVFARYQQGYDKGLNEFCKPLNGYLHGLKGSVNNNTCKDEHLDAFQHGFEQGKRIYELEDQISKTKSIINDEYVNHKDLKEERELTEERLNNISLSPQERTTLVQRIRLISAEQHRSVNIISNNQQILKDLTIKLAHAKNNNPYNTNRGQNGQYP